MPFEQSPPQLPYVDIQSEPLKTQSQVLQDNYALQVVNQTYWAYELFRTQNHDRRWSTHDSLYFGYVPPRVWDGSNVARASYTFPIVFDQVESALPAIVNSLFGISPEWFQVQAEPGTSAQDALQIQDAMSYILEHPKDEVGSNSFTEFKRAIKDVLLYGNGGVSVQWDAVLKRPVVEWVDLRDFYIDPGLSVPTIDESRSVIQRKFLTIQEVLDLKSDPRMHIPDNNILWYMAKNVPQAPAEQTKRIQEALRNIYFSPGFSDYLPLPADHKIEVLVYYSKSRIIWVLNKEWVAFNGPNPYGFIPFAFAPCYSVSGRFYGQSVADVQENNQRYIEALINGHYDELTLQLHPPRLMKRSMNLTPAQQRWRPGAVFSGDNKDDVNLLQVGNNTVNVFDDINWLTLSSEKRTGINSMGQGSIPSPSNANRTGIGIQAQMGGSNMRLSEIVSNVENYLLVPVLYKLYKILQFHTLPTQALPATNDQGDFYYVQGSVTQKRIKFQMLAASKMVTRDKLMQIVPFWMQIMAQGNLMEQLNKTGQTIDVSELFRMLQDATGVVHSYDLIRPLSQQEQQAMQQEKQQALQAQQQQAQQEGQVRQQIMQTKVQGDLQKTQMQGQTELQKEQIKKQPDFWQQQIDQNKATLDTQARQQEMQANAAANKQDMDTQRMMAILDLHTKQQHNQMNLAQKQAELRLAAQEGEQQRQSSAMDHNMKMAQMMQMMQMQQAQGQNQQSIADNFPATQGQQGETADQTNNSRKLQKRPLTKHGASKSKAKPPS